MENPSAQLEQEPYSSFEADASNATHVTGTVQ